MDPLERLELRVKDLEDEKKKFFRTGVVVLGSIVLSLLGYIWVIKVGWSPLIKGIKIMGDYVGLAVMLVGVGAVVWYFWDKIMNILGK